MFSVVVNAQDNRRVVSHVHASYASLITYHACGAVQTGAAAPQTTVNSCMMPLYLTTRVAHVAGVSGYSSVIHDSMCGTVTPSQGAVYSRTLRRIMRHACTCTRVRVHVHVWRHVYSHCRCRPVASQITRKSRVVVNWSPFSLHGIPDIRNPLSLIQGWKTLDGSATITARSSLKVVLVTSSEKSNVFYRQRMNISFQSRQCACKHPMSFLQQTQWRVSALPMCRRFLFHAQPKILQSKLNYTGTFVITSLK